MTDQKCLRSRFRGSESPSLPDRPSQRICKSSTTLASLSISFKPDINCSVSLTGVSETHRHCLMASSGPPRHQWSRVCCCCLLTIVWAGAARIACSSSTGIISEQKFDTADRGSTSAAGVAGNGPAIAGEIRYSPADAAVLSSKVEGTTCNWSSSAHGPLRGSSCQLGVVDGGS